jgi:rhomboid protease GluP
MAIGFTPKYTQDLPLGSYTPQQFLAIALEAARQREWTINTIAADGFKAYTGFSMSSYGEEITLHIADGIVHIKSECTGSQFMDMGKNKRNINRFLESFAAVETSLNAESLEALNNKLTESDSDAGYRESLHTPAENEGKPSGFFSFFIPRDGYFITPILINLNILIFIIMALTGVNIMLPSSESLLQWGANFRPMTLEGQWWRLISNCFLHIGIMHLLMNMYGLLYIGLLLEPYLGKLRFTIAYLLSGIAASVVSLWWHDLSVSAGASGAIFGMYGVFLALLSTSLIEHATRKALLTSIAIFVGYNLLYGMKGGIDNAAHIGGLVSGALIGYAFIPSLKKPGVPRLKSAGILIPVIAILIGTIAVYKNLSNDTVVYDVRIKEFVQLETEALQVLSMPENTPDATLLTGIQDKGIPNWKESLKLIDELDKLKLPEAIKERNKLLRTYSELRLKSFELLYKSVAEHSNAYDSQARSYNTQLEAVLKELGAGAEPDNQ